MHTSSLNDSGFIGRLTFQSLVSISAFIALAFMSMIPAQTSLESKDNKDTQLLDKVCAVAGTEVITMRDVEETLRLNVMSIGLPQPDKFPSPIFDEQLQALINEKLLYKYSVGVIRENIPEGMPTLTPEMKEDINEEVEKRISIIRKNYANDEAFEDELLKWNLNPDSLYQKIRQIESTRYVIGWGVGSMISMSRDEVIAYENELKKKGLPLYRFRLRYIYIPFPPDADEAKKNSTNIHALDIGLQIIRKQMTFEDAARKYSKAPGADDTGGDIGYVDSTDLDPAILKVLLKTRVDQITMPIETNDGYHIFSVEEKLDSNDFLYQKKFRELQKSIIEDMKKEMNVEVFDYK